MELREVRLIWEKVCGHELRTERASEFEGRDECQSLAAFSDQALRDAGRRVHQREGGLLLGPWLVQVNADVYDRSGARSGGASETFLHSRAREMKGSPTPSEKQLWNHLKAGLDGIAFERQQVVGESIPDFYAPAIRFAVEVDGSSHRLREAADERRDEQLKAMGVVVLRMTNRQVRNDVEGVVEAIRARMRQPDLATRVKKAHAKAEQASATRVSKPAARVAAPLAPAPSPDAGGRSLPVRVVYTPPAPKRRFRCQECDHEFVAPLQPKPRCNRHPDGAAVQLCAARDGRVVMRGADKCRECLSARTVSGDPGFRR